MLSIFKKTFFLLTLLFAVGVSACSPPAVTPDKWEYFNLADAVFIGEVKSSVTKSYEIRSSIDVSDVLKNDKNLSFGSQNVEIVSEPNSALCGFDEAFKKGSGILVFGTLDSSGDIEINHLDGTRVFDSVELAQDFYTQTYIEEGSCFVSTGYVFNSGYNQCLESTLKRCGDVYSDQFLETKIECEEKYVTEESPNNCNGDVVQCQDGTVLSRVPPTCHFEECPAYIPPVIDPNPWDGKIICTRDLKKCDDGSFVSRTSPPACEFAKCPVFAEPELCNADLKRCSDGTFVKRSGAFCAFEECGGESSTSIMSCDTIWTGYKFDDRKGTCLQVNIKGCQNTLHESKELCESENEKSLLEEGVRESGFTNCPLDYVPVCGTVGNVQNTYTNKCLMKLEGAELVAEGTCRRANSVYTKIVNWLIALFN